MKEHSYDPVTGKIYIGNKETFKALNSQGYHHGRFKDQFKMAHHVAWYMTHGVWPKAIDHINGDKIDNRIENLREVDQSVNVKNSSKRSHNTSGYTGIRKTRSGKWQARITVAGKIMNLGRFYTVEDALEARNEAKEQYGFTERHGV